MSTFPGTEARLQSTRQLLDELDALMERMLALPVNEAEGPTPALPELAPAPTVSATLTVLPPQPLSPTGARGEVARVLPLHRPERAPQDPHIFRESSLENQAQYATKEETESHELTEDKAPDEFLDVVPPPIMALQPPHISTASPPRRSWGSWIYHPALWFNLIFDRLTMLLGGPGQWLRSRHGRSVLGFAGLTLLALAVGWFVKDWLGWTW
ncbi:MAG: hypothetical protein L0Y72_15450 [Gemmataceae bacterium]|nr:hypothetical protein [Gemmataceae bacterium]MCI0740441.1 hypothetical protein [Gemmataceae bacterium]